MIDTVKIRLIVDETQIGLIFTNYSNLIGGVSHISKAFNQTWILDTSRAYSDEYLPRVSFRRWISDGEPSAKQYVLYIELSLPKLIYGHNLYELDDGDFEYVVEALSGVIETATSLTFSFDEIASATVTRIDFGKNIISDIPGFALDVMDIMSKQNISRRLDVTKQDYLNMDNRVDDGHGVRYHTKNYGFIIYDKGADLQKEMVGLSRAFNDYPTPERLRLINDLKGKGLSVLRLEARFNDGTKLIKKMLKSIGSTRCPTLQGLFSSGLAKDVMNHEWDKYARDIAVAELDNDELSETACNALRAGRDHHKLFEALGMQAQVNAIGVRRFRTLLDAYGMHDSWRAAKRLLGSIPKARSESIRAVDDELQRFKPIKGLQDYNKRR